MKRTSIVLSVMLLAPVLGAQTMGIPESQKRCYDAIAISSFTINPTQPAQNQVATLRLIVKNKCKGPYDIPWRIISPVNVTVASGTFANMATNEERTATHSWTATLGQHSFTAVIDPQNTIAETSRQNNTSAAINVTIGATVATTETRELKKSVAQNAGAQFPFNRESGAGAAACGMNQLVVMHMQGLGDETVETVLGCPGLPNVAGHKADPEFFKGVTLRNGWTVKEVRTDSSKTGNAGSNVVSKPNPGSTNPAVKAHLWAEPGGTSTFWVKIFIQGPSGTNPF